jgi:NADH-quinone oxidoreductase subunit G
MTPRFNPDVNSYWMCDIGRFDYHWIEGDRRLLQPHVAGNAVDWATALTAVNDAVQAAGGPGAVRFLASAHASLEELFVLREISGGTAGVSISWRMREKPQPANTKFKIPAVDAPNVHGARDLGFAIANPGGSADLGGLFTDLSAGRITVLYVLDPGPDGSLGDAGLVNAIVEARQNGRLNTLIVQGVLRTPIAAAADIVLPGAAYVEKDATYTNMQGRVQATSRAIVPPGEAGEDWQILAKLGVVFGRPVEFASGLAVREAIARAMPDRPAYQAIAQTAFARPVSARHWLQASNPSERWKWDFMFQDLPPIKFGEDFGPLPREI